MNFKIEGNGTPLVFIHGLSDSLLYWEFLASNLKRDYQIIRMDLRGHGESDLGNDEVNIDLYVDDLKNLLDDLSLDKVDIIGFSLGGAVALDFSLKYPENVSSLVLMSSFSKSDEYLTNIFTQFKYALKNSFEDFYDLILPMVLCPEVIDDNREALDQIRGFASKTANTSAYIKAVDACMEFDVDDCLSKIEVPTLVMSGKYDEISLLSSQRQLQKKIKNSKLIVFGDVKHNLLVGKNNEKVLEVLEKFYS